MACAAHKILQILRRVAGNKLSFGNNHDIVTDFPNFRQNMGTQDYRMILGQRTDQFPDFYDLLRIQPYGRLIQNDNLRKSQDRLGKAYPLLVSFGQIMEQAVLHLLKPC